MQLLDTSLFFRFGVACGIGILIGLQREFAHQGPKERVFAGVRTFALIGLLGCASALTTDLLNSPLPFVSMFLILGAIVTVSYAIDARKGRPGITTEVTTLLTALLGALVFWEQTTLAVAIGVLTTVLLSLKLELHGFVQRLTQEDIFATLKFAVITAIILPVLPNQTFGEPPFDVINPYKIWLLVVLISGISFVGYILVKLVGPQRGIGLMGLLGGLASSTAVTLSFTQRSQKDPDLARPLAFAIILAWTVMFGRVLVVMAFVNTALVQRLWLPLGAAILAGLAYGLYLYFRQRADNPDEISFSNPFELGPAIKFGLLFTVVLLLSKSAQLWWGNSGLYISSFLSGLADVDAIALSIAELTLRAGELDLSVAAEAIVLAAVANTFAKGVLVLVGGAPGLRRTILPGYLLMMFTGIAVIFMAR